MKTVQKYITIIIWSISILLSTVSFISGDSIKSSLMSSSAMFGCSIIITILYFVSLNERLKAIIVLLMIGLSCPALSIALGGNSWTFIASFLVLGLALLYYDPFILLAYSSVYVVVSVIVYIINPIYIVGPLTPASVGMFEIIAYIIMAISFYIGTRTGSTMIQNALMEEQEAQVISGQIEKNSEAAHENSLSLYENIEVSGDIIRVLSDEAEKVNENITTLKYSEFETIEIFQNLNGKIELSTKWLEENYQLISVLENNFETALKNVGESKEFSSKANNSLQDILNTIQHASECIETSTAETSKISAILKDIEEITSRTNLLAINASIEAARVGDAGHGFHIVAEQIRTLSVQSKQASENVKRILEGLTEALNTTGQKVNNGLTAIQLGINNLAHIENSLGIIDLYSNQSNFILSKEVEVFETIKEEFASMVREVEKAMETANTNLNEIQIVADSVQSQTNRTMLVSEQLKEMEGLANEIKKEFA